MMLVGVYFDDTYDFQKIQGQICKDLVVINKKDLFQFDRIYR